jgi:hypothetical protein
MYRHSVSDLPAIDGAKIQNAIIEYADLMIEDHGFLSSFIGVVFEGSGQGFGGYALYSPAGYKSHELKSPAGHFFYRCMEIAGVTNWKDMKGKAIRIYGTWNRIEAIGHIVNDDWFIPSIDFKRE